MRWLSFEDAAVSVCGGRAPRASRHCLRLLACVLREHLCAPAARRSLSLSRLHVVTGLARSDFGHRILTCTYRMGVNKMASVGCSPLSESDAANCTVLNKRQHSSSSNATTQRQQEFQQEKRLRRLLAAPCSGCSANGFGIHLRSRSYVSNDELARRAARCILPGGDM